VREMLEEEGGRGNPPCSGLEAPRITVETLGFVAAQARARWVMVASRLVEKGSAEVGSQTEGRGGRERDGRFSELGELLDLLNLGLSPEMKEEESGKMGVRVRSRGKKRKRGRERRKDDKLTRES